MIIWSILRINLTSVLHILITVLPMLVVILIILRLLPLFLRFIYIVFVGLNLQKPLFKISNELLVVGVPLKNFLQITVFYSNRIVKNRLDLVVIFLHDVFIPQTFLDLFHALHIRVHDFSPFVRVAHRHIVSPNDLLKRQIEIRDKHRVYKVDESVPYTTLSFEVHRQVEIIILALKIPVDQMKHILLQKLYGYILNHQSGERLTFLIITLSA